jgi:hypothetical protein
LTAYYYLDANGVVCWCDARVSVPAELDLKVAAVIEGLVNGSDATAISEITLLEIHSILHVHIRDSARPQHDNAWAESSMDEVMRWLAEGRVVVRPLATKMAEMAMVNIEQVSRLQAALGVPLKIRAWDAAHIYEALRWSRELGAKVTIVTGDKDIQAVVREEKAFGAHLEILDLNL